MKVEQRPWPACYWCGSYPATMPEYREVANEFGMTPDEYVRAHEATYNPDNGHFCCKDCYRKIGTPRPRGWKAP